MGGDHNIIDVYKHRDSFIHKLDPRVKLLTTIAFVIAVVATPPSRWPALSLYLALLLSLFLLSKLPFTYVLKRSLVIIPFSLAIALFIPFFKGGEVAGSYNIWMWKVSVTYSGLMVLWNVVVKAWLCVLGMILLSSTTQFHLLLKGMEQLHMPTIMVTMLAFMYRYLFVLVDELGRMRRARDSRDFGGKRMWQMRTVGHIIGVLFLRSYERGERVYMAMLARGFDGRVRTLRGRRLAFQDIYFAIAFFIVLSLISFYTRLWV